MSYPIQSAANRPVGLYQRLQRTTAPQAPRAPEANPTPQQAAPAAPANAAQSTAKLTAAEQHMIDSYFPASPKLTLRLYGPAQQAASASPATLGSRLDLRG